MFWLLDSNFSILLNFVLLYVLIGLLIIILGYEFLGISLLLIYSSGISIIFIITSMILGTKHVSLLVKSADKENTFVDVQNNILFNFLYFSFFITIFLTFGVSNSYEDLAMNLLVYTSYAGLLTTNTITSLNDTFVLGFLIYNRYPTHTTLAGLILIASLISSIYISQVN